MHLRGALLSYGLRHVPERPVIPSERVFYIFMSTSPHALPSITELPNELTDTIDLVPPIGIARILREVDAQLFVGWRGMPGIYDKEILDKLGRAVTWITEILNFDGPRRIVLSGAGTSGRLAYFTARAYNGILAAHGHEPIFDYIMAGGDAALIAAQEGAEDSPQAGIRAIQERFHSMQRGLYIGITCGVSAPYVAGQVDWLREHTEFYTILMGFNPPERARRVAVEGWTKTVGQVVDEMATHPGHMLLLNPIIGPEAITGSTRMKGGSMTKILLDLLFCQALESSNLLPPDDLPSDMELDEEAEEEWEEDDLFEEDEEWEKEEEADFAALSETLVEGTQEELEAFPRPSIERFEDQVRSVYCEREEIGQLIEAGGTALRSGGHIYYLGSGSIGVLALVDASECPPTFGDTFDHVRGFVEGGWSMLLGPGGVSPKDLPHYRLDLSDYERDILPQLKPQDLVVGVGMNGFTAAVERLMFRSLQSGAKTAAICIRCPGLCPAERTPPADPFLDPPALRNFADERTERRIPLGHGWLRTVPEWTTLCVSPLSTGHFFGPHRLAEAELAAKLCFNALTTGAHILAGKIYKNRMIDLRISNNKLYYRTLSIIQVIAGCDEPTARLAMHQSIFAKDDLGDDEKNAPPSVCIPIATWKDRIVPRAILLASGRFNVETATDMLRKEPIVRRLVEQLNS